MGDLTTEAPPTPPKEPRRWKTWQLVTASVVALLVGVGIGSSGSAEDDGKDVATNVSSSSDEPDEENDDERTTTSVKRTTTTRRPTTTTQAPYFPAAADFQVDLIVIEKNCFGSAGCNVTYETELRYVGPRPLEPGSSWQLIYEVRGGDESKIGSIELDGDGNYDVDRELISTPNESAEISAVVTNVRER